MVGFSPKMMSRAGAALAALLGLFLLPGCGTDGYSEDLTYPVRTDPIVVQPPPGENLPTRLDGPGELDSLITQIVQARGKVVYPKELSADQRTEIGNKLTELFGTPAHPKVPTKEQDNASKLDEQTLREGAKLYRRHCLHCHGLTGDGRGPTGPWVNPHPRDYRAGIFKFSSSAEAAGRRKPLREDLARVLRNGIESTSMPSFAMLEDKEIDALVSYVIHLSLRGQAELDAMRAVLDPSGGETPDIGATIERSVFGSTRPRRPGNLDLWLQADSKRIEVPPAPVYTTKPYAQLTEEERKELKASITRGYHEFLTGSAQCKGCHNNFGRANDYRYDAWGTITKPANLTAGLYRGGRRPVDLFYRMHSGINGSAMPGFDALPPQTLWDIVNFIRALPYPNMLPDEPLEGDPEKKSIREKVYPKT